MIRRLGYLAVLFALVAVVDLQHGTTSAAPADRILQMTIYNDAGVAAISDRPFDLATKYTDYQWVPASERDVCVYGTNYPDGLAYMGLNRRQGFADNLWCNEHPGLESLDRYYTLIVSDSGVCSYLRANSLVDDGNPSTDPCALVPARNPRVGGFQPHVRVPTLFKNKAKTSIVRFQFELADGRQYSVDTDSEATIQTDTTDKKTIAYFKLASFNSPDGKIGQSFPFPFHLMFTRQ